MTDPEVIRYIDQMCVKDGDIEVKNICKDGSYTLTVPVVNGGIENNAKQIATLEMESYFDGDEIVLLNFPQKLLSDEDYIYIAETIEEALSMGFEQASLEEKIKSASTRAAETRKPEQDMSMDSLDERISSLKDCKGYEAFYRDFLVLKNVSGNSSLPGITASTWLDQISALSDADLRSYVERYKPGLLDPSHTHDHFVGRGTSKQDRQESER